MALASTKQQLRPKVAVQSRSRLTVRPAAVSRAAGFALQCLWLYVFSSFARPANAAPRRVAQGWTALPQRHLLGPFLAPRTPLYQGDGPPLAHAASELQVVSTAHGAAMDYFQKADRNGFYTQAGKTFAENDACKELKGSGKSLEQCAQICLDFGESCGGFKVNPRDTNCWIMPQPKDQLETSCEWKEHDLSKYYERKPAMDQFRKADRNGFYTQAGKTFAENDACKLLKGSGKSIEQCAQICLDFGESCGGFKVNRKDTNCWIMPQPKNQLETSCDWKGHGPSKYYERKSAMDPFRKADRNGFYTQAGKTFAENDACKLLKGSGKSLEQCAQICLDFGESCGGFKVNPQDTNCWIMPQPRDQLETSCEWQKHDASKYYERKAAMDQFQKADRNGFYSQAGKTFAENDACKLLKGSGKSIEQCAQICLDFGKTCGGFKVNPRDTNCWIMPQPKDQLETSCDWQTHDPSKYYERKAPCPRSCEKNKKDWPTKCGWNKCALCAPCGV